MTKLTTIILLFCAAITAQAIIIPIDLGPPRTIKGDITKGERGDIFISSDGLKGTPLDGQILSLDYQFNRLVALRGATGNDFNSGFYFRITAQISTIPETNYSSPPLFSNGYALGLNDYQGPVSHLIYTGPFTPEFTELLFGLAEATGPRPLYLTGLHFDVTLPEIEGVEIMGLKIQLDPDSFHGNWQIVDSVPETGTSAAFLGLGLLMLVGYRYHRNH